MSGLFTSTIGFVKTSNPEAFVDNLKNALAQLNGTSGMGMVMETKFEPAATEIEATGTKLDAWTINLKADDNADQDMGQAGMILKMAFGATGGPGGYLARVDGGIFQTFGKNSTLMASALAVGKGGESIASDKLLEKVSEQLPKDRAAEVYVSFKNLLDAAMPFMAMGGMNIDMEIPASLPPVGIGISGGQGGAHFGVYVPAQTLKTVVKFANQAKAAQMGNDGPDAGEGKKNAPKNGAGQPRF